MKKRRQLDALVGNGKTRRKSKSGHELLRSNADTDSSDLDQFSVDSDNSRLTKHRNQNLCSICMTVIGFCLLAACIIACAGLIWMHLQLKRDIATLQDQMKSVESKNDAYREENQKLTSNLQVINKTLQELKTQKVVVNGKNITNLRKEIEAIKSMSKPQKNSMTKAELDNFQAEFQTLKKTVAKLGSDVTVNTDWKKQAQSSIDEVKSRLDQKLDELNLKIKKVEVSGLIEAIQNLNTSIETLNKSLSLELETNKGTIKEIEKNNTRIINLIDALNKENVHTESPAKVSLNITAIKENLKNELEIWLRKMLVNETQQMSGPKAVVTDIHNRIENVTESIDLLWKKIDELKKENNVSTTDAVDQGTFMTVATFQTYRSNISQEIQHLNDTTEQLHLNLLVLQNRFDTTKIELLNLTKKVTKFADYSLKYENETGKLTPKTASPIFTTTLPTKSTTIEKHETSTISIPDIKNWKDLEKDYNAWNETGEGKVSYKTISDAVIDLPASEEFALFDKDKNDLYSLEELQNALGFHPSAKTPDVPPEE